MRAIYFNTLGLLFSTLLCFTESCGPTGFDPVSVKETDEPGTFLLNITAEVNVTWRIEPPIGVNYKWFSTAISILDDPTNVTVELNKTLDLELIFEEVGEVMTSLKFKLYCRILSDSETGFDFFVIIEEVNEYTPTFVGAPFNISVPENTQLGTVLIRLRDNATDRDVASSSSLDDIQEFNMVPLPKPGTSSWNLFDMKNRQDGEIRVNATLDFESFPTPDSASISYSITVWDRAKNHTTSSLIIHIEDVDDQPPEFYYQGCSPIPCYVVYSCQVSQDFTGIVTNMTPANILARDGDTLGYPVRYSLGSGLKPLELRQDVAIDSETGVFSVLRPLDQYSGQEMFVAIQAVEVSEKALSKDTTLLIKVWTQKNMETAKKEESSSNAGIIAAVVLAVFIVLALLVLAAVFIYLKKRHVKTVSPVDNLKDKAKEGREDRTKGEGDGSNTDSGRWSMTGLPSPSSGHTNSVAPAQTQLQQANGRLAGEQPSERNPQNGVIPHEDMQQDSYDNKIYRQGNMALVHAQMHGQGQSGSREQEGESENVPQKMLQSRRLPPLSIPSETTGSKRSRSSRKQRKQEALAKQQGEMFDGTKSYPMSADIAFFMEGNKQKVKMSSRKRNGPTLDPKYWMTVDDDY